MEPEANRDTKTLPHKIESLHTKKEEEEAAESSPIRGIELPKNVTPDRLQVPKAFKYPERYRSPTAMMVSPITRGLIARTRRGGGALLPPIRDQLKMQDLGALS